MQVSPKLANLTRGIFPAVMLGLLVSHAFDFFRYQKGPHWDGFRPLQVHWRGAGLGDLREASRKYFTPYFRLQDEMRGAELVVPRGVSVRTEKWRHIGLIGVQHDGQRRSVSRKRSELLKSRHIVTTVKVDGHHVLFLVDPRRLRGQRVYLLETKGNHKSAKRDLFATNEVGLRALEPYLNPVTVR